MLSTSSLMGCSRSEYQSPHIDPILILPKTSEADAIRAPTTWSFLQAMLVILHLIWV